MVLLLVFTTTGPTAERSAGATADGEVRLTAVGGPLYVGQWIALRASGVSAAVRLDGALPEIAGLRLVPALESGEPAGTGVVMHATASRVGVCRIPALSLMAGETSCRSLPLALEIRSIPAAGRPSEFAGGVGPITGMVGVAPDSAMAGDWFELELVWSGPGAAGMATGVPLTGLPEGVEVRERARELEFDSGTPSRRYRWRLRSDRPGAIAVPPQRVATFDPASGRFFTRSTPGVRVTVAPRPRLLPEPAATGTTPESSVDDGHGDRLGPGLVILGCLLLLGGLSFWVFRRRRRSPQRFARKLAARLDSGARVEDPATSARAIEAALRQYLECATGRDLATPTPAELRAALRELGAPAGLAEAGARLLDRCDEARYGAGVADQPADAQDPTLRAAAVSLLHGLARLPEERGGAGGRTTQPAERPGARRAV